MCDDSSGPRPGAQSVLFLAYLSGDGKSPFESWFDDLDAAASAKLSVALVRLGQGNTSNTETIREGVQEYRIDWEPAHDGGDDGIDARF
jgi:hypothetical protein